MKLKKFTPTFILGVIAVIFAYDTIASGTDSHATISEWFCKKLHKSIGMRIIYITAFIYLTLHFWFFK